MPTPPATSSEGRSGWAGKNAPNGPSASTGVPGLSARSRLLGSPTSRTVMRMRRSLGSADSELRRLKHRLSEAESALETAKRATREGRGTEDMRLRLLLDVVLQGAQGLQRELGLAPVSARPADSVEAVTPTTASPHDVARRALQYLTPGFTASRAAAATAASQARNVLGGDRFAQAWDEGRELTLDDAVAYATRRGGGRKRPATGWASLTPAEQEVARLAGEGLRNDAIAQRLFIAPGTVKVHLSHIFAKLGVTTRTELAAQAASRDLTAGSSGE